MRSSTAASWSRPQPTAPAPPQRYHAERYAYIPTVIFGSGLGYSIGPPIAIAGQAPSLFNITHDQTLLNFAARETIKAAHSDSIAANIDYVDHTEQVILDTSLLYIELDNTQQRLTAAQQQKQAVDHALYIAQQRQTGGRWQRAWTASAPNSIPPASISASPNWRPALDVLRERLGRAIGRSPATLATVSDSIPAAPALPVGGRSCLGRARQLRQRPHRR